MSDLISRQAAIDCMMLLQREDEETYGASIPEGFDGERAKEVLEQLPSAKPLTDTDISKGQEFTDYICNIIENLYNKE